MPLCPLKILHEEMWYGTHVSTMTSLRVTAQKTERGTAYFTLKLTKQFKCVHETLNVADLQCNYITYIKVN